MKPRESEIASDSVVNDGTDTINSFIRQSRNPLAFQEYFVRNTVVIQLLPEIAIRALF